MLDTDGCESATSILQLRSSGAELCVRPSTSAAINRTLTVEIFLDASGRKAFSRSGGGERPVGGTDRSIFAVARKQRKRRFCIERLLV